jgi:hypothetical protein
MNEGVSMSSVNTQGETPAKDMSRVWAGRRAAAARARAEKARAELESQGWTVIPPEESKAAGRD